MNLKGTFFIASLPRSRTAWLANFLTLGESCCYHEVLRFCTSMEELKGIFDRTGTSYVGDSDSGIPFFADEIAAEFTGCRFVIVDRPPDEVLRSLQKTFPNRGINFEELVKKTAHAIQRMKEKYQPLVVKFSDLARMDVCERVWNYCLPQLPFNEIRWKSLNSLKIEIIPEVYLKSFSKKSAEWLLRQTARYRIEHP